MRVFPRTSSSDDPARRSCVLADAAWVQRSCGRGAETRARSGLCTGTGARLNRRGMREVILRVLRLVVLRRDGGWGMARGGSPAEEGMCFCPCKNLKKIRRR